MSKEEVERIDDAGTEAWNTKDDDSFVALLADDFIWKDVTVPEPMRDTASARQYMRTWFTAFPDMKVKLVNRVLTDDAAAGELEFTGTNSGPMQMGGQEIPPTGKPVQGKGAYFLRVKDGKVAEFSTYPDVAGMMMQLGLIQM